MHLCWLWCLGAAAGPGRASRRRAERSSRRGRRAGGPPPPGTNTQTSKRTQAPRTASGQLAARRTESGQLAARASRRHAERSSQRGLRDDTPSEAHGADAERAGRAGSSRHGRRAGGPSQRPAARTPSGRAERAAHSADAEQAGRRPRAPTRRTRAYNEAGTRRAKQRRGPRPRETVRPGGPP